VQEATDEVEEFEYSQDC